MFKMPKTKLQRTSLENDQKENQIFKSRKLHHGSSVRDSVNRKPLMPWRCPDPKTENLLLEMGLQTISQDSRESLVDQVKSTPATIWNGENSSQSSFHLPPVPAAPRILLTCQRDNITSGSDESSEDSLSITPTLKHAHIFKNHELVKETGSKTDKKSVDHFTQLSDEIVLCIFRWLPKFVLAKCARVCKRWSRLLLDESLWKRMDLSNRIIKAGSLGHVLNRGAWALRLAKSDIEGPIFTGPTSVINSTRLSKLQFLDLSMAGTTPQVLEAIFSICRDLKKLSLENLPINDKICSLLGENKNLEELNLAMCDGISATGLIPLTTNCRQLESLNIGWTNLHLHSVVYLCLCLPPSLQKLNFSGCRESITDDMIEQLCKTCPDLAELDISDATKLTCETVTAIANTLMKLEHLAVSRCYKILPSTLLELVQLPNLYAVDMFGMLTEEPLEILKISMSDIKVNEFPFSSIARPTTGIRRTSIWGVRTRDNFV